MNAAQGRLRHELERVALRFRRLELWRYLTFAWLTASVLGGVAWAALWLAGRQSPLVVPVVVLSAVGLAVGAAWRALLTTRDDRWVARQIESRFPELKTCLLAAVEQRPELPWGQYGYLQSRVIQEALQHAHRNSWSSVVPQAKLVRAFAVQAVSLVILVGVIGGMHFFAPSALSSPSPAVETPLVNGEFQMAVEPGNTEVEQGTSLLVLAQFQGHIPEEVTLVVTPSEGEELRLPMDRSLADPVFGSRVAAVDAPLHYRVQAAGQTSETYQVNVFQYPRLERTDVALRFPDYTGMESRRVEDVRTVSVVEGTELTVICHLNKPVASAAWREEGHEPIVLEQVSGETPTWQTVLQGDRSRRLELELVDEAGRENVQPASLAIQVVPNRPVALKPLFPGRDLEVSPLEEVELKASVWDDYQVKRFGLTYSLAGQAEREVVFPDDPAAAKKREATHLVLLEELKAEPDQLLAYHWWAEDTGPDGVARRVQSDMYFAEVRPFDEIFRQGESPPGGAQEMSQSGGQNAQAAEQLSELQKQIINATWTVVRREIGPKLAESFPSDVEELIRSQVTARQQAVDLSGQLQDSQSQQHAKDVLDAMSRVVSELTRARELGARDPLAAALAAEQEAYQGLLRLRAREHRVVRQQNRSAGNASGRSSQQRQQLEQLDLSMEENRYETQRTAQDPSQQSAEDRENRQVLNRLRELARRQHDLNERLKELQSALTEAKTASEQEEIRRQLKRLQDEQRQILQDTEELQSRMDAQENQERMADAREQLGQTREQVRRSSEALEQEMVSQAAAAGTRAERQFEGLRDEFRRRSAGQFSAQAEQLQEAARDLERRQEQITEKLKPEAPKPAEKSLRSEDSREPVAGELAEQRQRLGNLQQQMRNTIEEAEATEPLLAQRLYDATRGIQEGELERSLASAETSIRQGLMEDARNQEGRAGQGIRRLREEIDRAAQSVLGDETEALRRAEQELNRLSRALNDEIAQNSPQDALPERENPSGNRQGANPEARPDSPNSAGTPEDNREPGSEGRSRSSADRDPTAEGSDRTSAERQSSSPREDEKPPGDAPSERMPGGRQPGEGKSESRQPGNSEEPGDAPGEDQSGQSPRGSGRASSELSRPNASQTTGNRAGERQSGGRSLGAGGNAEERTPRTASPLTGDGFREWSDRLRDVEEMVDDPDLRAEAARIRERARSIRAEHKRHSAMPQWDLVRDQLARPLASLQDRVREEVLRRTSRQSQVPLDRDPVPPKYSEKTRMYYEQLGTGR